MKEKKQKLALVLGGGGARGVSHIGVLKVLQENGIKPDFLVGCSMGSMIGAYYALGLDMDKLEEFVTGYRKRDAIMDLLDIGIPLRSVLKGRKVDKFISKLLKKSKFSQTKIPLYIMATDLETGEEVVLSRGDISEAVKASLCVPGIFPPVKIGRRYLIDGGVTNPTPIDVAKRMGAKKIIAVDLISNRSVNLSKPGMITTLMQSYEIIRTEAIKLKLSPIGSQTILIKPKVGGTVDSFKFTEMPKFIKIGIEAAKEALPKIKKLLK